MMGFRVIMIEMRTRAIIDGNPTAHGNSDLPRATLKTLGKSRKTRKALNIFRLGSASIRYVNWKRIRIVLEWLRKFVSGEQRATYPRWVVS
jgi:hypothetical protein